MADANQSWFRKLKYEAFRTINESFKFVFDITRSQYWEDGRRANSKFEFGIV